MNRSATVGARLSLAAVAALLALLLAACDWTQTTRAVDGDTIDTTLGRVRVIGIDTPERGECGYSEATNRVTQLLVGGPEEIVFNSPDHDETDKYGRLLRHVLIKDAGDLGEILIREGYANARYDSLDGYDRHIHQDKYRALDFWTPHRCGPAADAVSDLPPPSGGSGDVYYENCTVARNAGAAPIHRGEPGYRAALDRDGDGVACE